MRVVLDTNMLLSGLMYPHGPPGEIVRAWRESRFDIVLSIEQLTEIARVLSYPKIRKILKWDRVRIEGFIKQLYLRTEMVNITGISAIVPRDSKDSAILATLTAAGADYLVTGDKDLLALRGHYAVLTPAEFARRI
jgi:putative PIN family toxin of toxin-antitoxin system